MKKIKYLVFVLALMLVFPINPANTMAATNETPASIVARLTGRTIEDVINERMETGKTYGTIAKENGKLDEFKKECLKIKEKVLKNNVEKGLLSQAEADSILAAIKANQAICDGDGTGYCGNQGYGKGYGKGRGWNSGNNAGKGRGGYGFCGGNACIYN